MDVVHLAPRPEWCWSLGEGDSFAVVERSGADRGGLSVTFAGQPQQSLRRPVRFLRELLCAC